MTEWPFRGLATPRLALRALAVGDAPGYLEVFSDPDVMRYWSSEPIATLDEARELLAQDLEWVAAGDALCWALALPDSDRLIGKVNLYLFSRRNRRAEIGYVLGHRYWGLGLMSEAIGAVLDFGFDTLGLHRIEADVDPEHDASLALLDKFGFAREGRFRERWNVHGEWRDSVMLGLLAADFRAARTRRG